ncbi:hypothetical protein P692DRAFT_201852213 [Suillus brevipes Sb2]|nr:hypothetical protein P692DRAFT_201852213 [Suillus brevipes Sb2]
MSEITAALASLRHDDVNFLQSLPKAESVTSDWRNCSMRAVTLGKIRFTRRAESADDTFNVIHDDPTRELFEVSVSCMRSDKLRAIASGVTLSLDFSGLLHLSNINFKLGARRRVMKNRTQLRGMVKAENSPISAIRPAFSSQDNTMVVLGQGTVHRKAADDQLLLFIHLSARQARLN